VLEVWVGGCRRKLLAVGVPTIEMVNAGSREKFEMLGGGGIFAGRAEA